MTKPARQPRARNHALYLDRDHGSPETGSYHVDRKLIPAAVRRLCAGRARLLEDHNSCEYTVVVPGLLSGTEPSAGVVCDIGWSASWCVYDGSDTDDWVECTTLGQLLTAVDRMLRAQANRYSKQALKLQRAAAKLRGKPRGEGDRAASTDTPEPSSTDALAHRDAENGFWMGWRAGFSRGCMPNAATIDTSTAAKEDWQLLCRKGFLGKPPAPDAMTGPSSK